MLAAFAMSFFSCINGMVAVFSIIVVPALLGSLANLNPDETISMTPTDIFWLG